MNPIRTTLLFDFDGTCFKTFNKSPRGLDVHIATEQAVQNIFGPRGTEIYHAIGGLQNRAPSELIIAMYSHGLKPLDNAVENFVQEKLHILTGEIGTTFDDGRIWPEPCNGFSTFWETAKELQKQGVPLDTGIISSGHAEFILKTFQETRLLPPDILVTEDDIRHRKFPQEMERRVKPGQWPIARAHYHILKNQDLLYDLPLAKKTRDHIIFFGDSVKSDGGLAERADIVFGLFNPDTKFSTLVPHKSFAFNDWEDIGSILKNNQDYIKEGRPIHDIFFTHGIHQEYGKSNYLLRR